MEHVGNALGIDGESSPSNPSDVESSSSSSESKESEECCVETPKADRFKKRTYQTTSMENYFAKQPKLSFPWKDLIHDMALRAVFLVVTFTVPAALFVNADHTGILHIQVRAWTEELLKCKSMDRRISSLV